jgi:hypothetical protein
MRRWDNILKLIFIWWEGVDWIYFVQGTVQLRYSPVAVQSNCGTVQLRVVANKLSVSVKGNKFRGWLTVDFKDGVYRPTHAAYRVQLEQDASTSTISLIASVNIMNWKFFFRRRNKEQIKFGECLLTFGPDCFVFPSATKQRKSLNHNFTCYLQGFEMLSLIPKECTY